jgi:P-type E1-E2 ATPase
MFARIISLVEQAEEQQAPVQKLADKVAGWLIPVVFVFLVGVYIVTHDLRKIVTLLIFTSPAELGLATPLVMIAAIARAARHGILVKGGLYLEALAKADAFAFDKTGTLTLGELQVVGISPLAPGITDKDVIALAAAADRRSGHPIARAIVQRAAQLGIDIVIPNEFEMVAGRGVKAKINGRTVIVGNQALLEANDVQLPSKGLQPTTTVFVAVDGQCIGVLEIADRIRPGAAEAIAGLNASGVRKVVMLTGDNQRTAQHIADELHVDEVCA